MAGDGVKTNLKKRKRSQRNKIVSAITAIGGTATTIEQTMPGVLPPGSGVMVGQVSALLAILVNQFWPN